MKDISKSFGNIHANKSVNLNISRGTIHAAIGENGAGKTTLMKILYGMIQPDSGSIFINEKEVILRSPLDAIRLKIGMVHQHFMLVHNLTVLENIILGAEQVKYTGWLDIKSASKKIDNITKSFNLKIDTSTKISELSVGQQQKVEIIKLLYRDADILILDEPTSVLTPQEAEDLFATLRELKKQNKTIIFISHKLREVIEISDTITVLRRGEVAANTDKVSTDTESLIRYMIGESLNIEIPEKQKPQEEIILEVKNLSVKDEKKTERLRDISFELRKGEIFGIAGVEGNGQTELAEAISYLCSHSSGEVFLDDYAIDIKTLISYIPADRNKYAIVDDYKISENMILGRTEEKQFSSKWKLNFECINSYTDDMIGKFSITPANRNYFIKKLSGGNQQKVVIARELGKETKLIIANQPTRGLDISSTMFVYEHLLEESRKGKVILLISSDLEELLKLSHRIAVMFNGKISVIFEADKTTETELGKYMTGSLN